MDCISFQTVWLIFVSEWVVTENIFPLLSKAWWSRINSCYCILFSNLKQKEHTVIISWLINSLMGPMYIQTLPLSLSLSLFLSLSLHTYTHTHTHTHKYVYIKCKIGIVQTRTFSINTLYYVNFSISFDISRSIRENVYDEKFWGH